MRLIHLINLVLAAVLIGFAVWAWGVLPDQIPVHFSADGEVTRWEAKSFFAWFGPTLIGVATVALNYGLAAWLPDRPHLVNLPDKKRFLALPTQRQAAVIRPMQSMLYGLSAPLLALFWFIQLGIYAEATGGSAQPYIIATLVLAVLMGPVLLIVALPGIQSALDREWRAHQAESS